MTNCLMVWLCLWEKLKDWKSSSDSTKCVASGITIRLWDQNLIPRWEGFRTRDLILSLSLDCFCLLRSALLCLWLASTCCLCWLGSLGLVTANQRQSGSLFHRMHRGVSAPNGASSTSKWSKSEYRNTDVSGKKHLVGQRQQKCIQSQLQGLSLSFFQGTRWPSRC